MKDKVLFEGDRGNIRIIFFLVGENTTLKEAEEVESALSEYN